MVKNLGWEDPLEEGMATLLYSCLENPHGQRSLAGYSPWGRKELDVTEQQKNNNKENRGKQSVRVMLGRNQQNLTVWVGGKRW